MSNFRILVLKRDNDVAEDIIKDTVILQKHKEAFIELKGIEKIDLSSSVVREKVKKGEDITNLVPKEIKFNVIEEYKN